MFINADDIVNGREGQVLVKAGSDVVTAAEISSITATIDINKTEVPTLGTSALQTKETTWKGTGSMTVYFSTSFWADLLLNFTKYKKSPEFEIVATVEDKATELGAYRVKLGRCKLDGGDVLKLSTSDDYATGDYNFTFSDWEILERFNDYRTLS